MKKSLAVLGLFLFPLFAFASFDTDLKYGSKGDEVIALQEFLTDQGVYSGPISGNFYSLTLRAVKTFQKGQGISPQSGYVGPITRGKINALIEVLDSEGGVVVTDTVQTSQPSIQTVIPVASAPDCTPTLTSSVRKDAGEIATGIDFTFIATSTFPIGCPVNLNTEGVLQTPTIRYTGGLSSQLQNGHLRLIDNGYVYTQGWGTGSGVIPAGSFTWSIFGTSTRATIQ